MLSKLSWRTLTRPKGLADQAGSVGLVPSAELVSLTPVLPGRLPPPTDDPFLLAGKQPVTFEWAFGATQQAVADPDGTDAAATAAALGP